MTAGFVTIGRNTFVAEKNDEDVVTYNTKRGSKVASAKIAKTFVVSEIDAAIEARKAEFAGPVEPHTEFEAPKSNATIAQDLRAMDKGVEAEKATPAKPKARKNAPVIVTDKAKTLLVYVAAHQKHPKVLHLQSCPHFEGKATFAKATDEQVGSLKFCPDDLREAQRQLNEAASK